SVHPDYGNLTDLRELVDKAHALDMAVMLDWVANHTAWDHAWIADKTWYVTDGSGNIVHPPGTNWQDVAELNYANSKMRLEMIKAMKYWVLEANVDGFRCDYATGVSSTFWKQAIDTLRNIPNRDLILFAEAEDKALLNAGFDLIFGWPYYGRLKDVFSGLAATQIHNMHLTEYNGLASGKHVVRWITNHDQHAWEATPQSIFGSVSAATAAFVITSYMGGVPLIYNGQEVATPNQLPFFEGTNATINWNLNPAIKAEHERILNLRKNSAALRRGTLTDYSSSNVAAFTRKQGNEEVLVLVNVRNSNQDFTLPANLRLSDWYDAYSNAPVSLATTVSLGAYQYRVLKR
ncbi:MAG TPA: alpha-amylase family glycosyl hydrolase, partial [Saprospiraceae bacterium]|nr:alpha-amylase family glycosyl hydrolase [Saprospiraceae bacterium]